MKELPKWDNLKSLVLFRTKITDEGLKGLAGLSSLDSLDISYTDCTGAGLANLPNRKSLHRLEMMNAKVTDEGVRALTGMTALDFLRLDGNRKLTGVTLSLLADMKGLRYLSLSKTGLTNDGLKGLPELPLKDLHLSSTKITDEGIKELAKQKSARTLDIGGTPVTGAGLKAPRRLDDRQCEPERLARERPGDRRPCRHEVGRPR